MDIKWLKTFITAAKHENFRKTSEELFLTQPAITKHIKRLEEHLNVQLFERTGKAIVLTAAGYKFLPNAREIVLKYELGLEEFEAWKQGYKRKLIIAAAPQIASSILPSILRSFMNENPDIEVLINIANSYEIGEEIGAGRAEVGLSRIEPIQTNVHFHKAHQEQVIMVGPQDSKNESEKTILQKYRLITHNHPDYWDQLLKDVKRIYPAVQTMKVNQIEISKRFIEQGLGISFLPISMVREELMMNKLTEIEADEINLPSSSTYILTKAETSEARLFIQFFKENLLNHGGV
jgi:LysR family transcriptional repressor of citA